MMKEEKLKKLSSGYLKQKIRSLWIFIGVFIVLIAFFILSLVKDYLNGKDIDYSIATIMICCVGGMVSLFPELNALRKELANRN